MAEPGRSTGNAAPQPRNRRISLVDAAQSRDQRRGRNGRSSTRSFPGASILPILASVLPSA